MRTALKVAMLILAAGLVSPVQAEPLLTLVGFGQGAYNDAASSEIVVKIMRVDQDPATENEQFTVECTLNGGTAVENVDYRVQGLGRVVFPPGVREQSVSIQTMKSGGADKTLLIGLSNPSGPAPVVTGENPVAQITIINQR
jgi:hypothetical protein